MRAPPIPSSLKWLFNRKARLAGEILRRQKLETGRAQVADKAIEDLRKPLTRAIEREAAKARVHALTIEQLEHEISATDMLIRAHEAGVDPSIIRPKRTNQNLVQFDFGFMTRCIYKCLGMTPDRPCTAADVAALIVALQCQELTPAAFSDFRYRVRQRMKHLAWEGKPVRVKEQVGSLAGRWLIHPDILKLPHGIHQGDDALANSLATTETAPLERIA